MNTQVKYSNEEDAPMTEMSAKDVAKLAELSRLEFADEAAAEIQQELNSILQFVTHLSSADVSQTQPTFSPVTTESTLEREDTVTVENDRDNLQTSAPSTDMGFFVVPRVVE